MNKIGCQLCSKDWEDLGQEYFASFLNSEMKMMRDDVFYEYKCPNCNSRARTRTLYKLIEEIKPFFLKSPQKMLVVSSPKLEKSVATKYSDECIHVSLHGDHGDNNCIVGEDMLFLKCIKDGSIDCTMACDVLDYIPELNKVFEVQNRILKSDGLFLFNIQSFRLLDKGDQMRVKHTNALSHEAYAQNNTGGETGIPDCEFSVNWIMDQAKWAGLQLVNKPILDDISTLIIPWFIAKHIK